MGSSFDCDRLTVTSDEIRIRHYPEVVAGGFTRVDGTIQFYSRVLALLPEGGMVLEFGAGRGANILEDKAPYRQQLRTLKGRGCTVFGVDVDPVVLENPFLDEARVIASGEPLPFADGTFGMIVSDYVFEHVPDPEWLAGELGRVLKPGGWICARTPNKWSLLGMMIRMIPNRHHVQVLKEVQPDRKAVDVFPTTYRLNSLSALRRHFPETHWLHASHSFDAEPSYAGNSDPLWYAFRILFRLSPRAFRSNLFIFMKKLG